MRRPAWSPDGRSLVVVAEDRKGLVGVYRMDVLSGELSAVFQVERRINIRWPQFLPDEKWLVYERLGLPAKTRSIIVRNLETGEEKEFLRAVAPAYFGGMRLSPDGQRVAFVWSDGPQSQSVRVITMEGGEVRELYRADKTSVLPGSFTPQWTPDGKYMLIVQGPRPTTQPQEPAENEVWRISTSGGEAQRVGLAIKQLRDLALHPDGVRLAFTVGEQRSEVWVMENFLPVLKASK